MVGALARAIRYLDAGADAIFPEALPDRKNFIEFARKLPGAPLLANMTEFGRSPALSADELQSLGYRMVIWPVAALRTRRRKRSMQV
ncbi:isocitrate lyase/phosphoenolpyruvate mutase family protein [Devosia sp.]|uniref:isocitrate lyase/phosphoenolpyruvate mutase family protein n=1 Tax=Devosia sp. TaxID=1871048 RepID=UPI00260A5F5E|nr:isocitrate lyase/phosphoenolpyruvate mutase family protein [Devosia sp.]